MSRNICSTVLRNVAQGKVTCNIHGIRGRTFCSRSINKPLAQRRLGRDDRRHHERRKLEQERDRNYAFLRQIIDHIPSQITVKDVRDRRYVLVNRVAETQFGLPRDQIVGKTAFELFPKADGRIDRRGR